MLSISKILLPVDFSVRCVGAAHYAKALAGHFRGEVTLLHVLEPMRYEFSTLEFGGTVLSDLLANREAQVRGQLDAFLAEELAGTAVKRVLLDGDPARKIVEYAHGEQMDVIAMPTHGYGPFRRFILGSVAAKVLHDADCPVWTGVHLEEGPTADPITFSKIVCAVDLGPHSRKTLCWAAHFTQEFGAQLVLSHAVPCIDSPPGEYFDQDLVRELAASARLEVEKLRDAHAPGAEISIERGDPPTVVCETARRAGADLLVISRGSAAGLFGRLRTNAYAIIRQSPCAVVSV